MGHKSKRKKNEDPQLTERTEETRLARYLLYFWVQRNGEDFIQAERPLIIEAQQILNARIILLASAKATSVVKTFDKISN